MRRVLRKPGNLRVIWERRLRLKASQAEALLAILASRLAVRFCFRTLAPWALRMRHPGDAVPAPALERRVRYAIHWANRLLPGASPCLSNAIAAKFMLQRRGFASSIHLGAGLRDGSLHAHAWLEAGGIIITGEGNKHTVAHIPRG